MFALERPNTRRESRSLRPLFSKTLAVPAAIMGETGDSRRNLSLDSSAKNVISPVNLGVILKRPPRLPNRVHSGLIWISLDKSSSLQMPGWLTLLFRKCVLVYRIAKNRVLESVVKSLAVHPTLARSCFSSFTYPAFQNWNLPVRLRASRG